MINMITPNAVVDWLQKATDENHSILNCAHKTDNMYWACDKVRLHISSLQPMSYFDQSDDIGDVLNNFLKRFDAWDIKWQGVIPAWNLYTGADYAAVSDIVMSIKGYQFDPALIKDAIQIMDGFITGRVLVNPQDARYACLHVVRTEFNQIYQAYVMCMLRDGN